MKTPLPRIRSQPRTVFKTTGFVVGRGAASVYVYGSTTELRERLQVYRDLSLTDTREFELWTATLNDGASRF